MGSSGSRLFVYKKSGEEVIGLKPKKISPGIASMAHDPIEAANYLRPLFEYAKEMIPESHHEITPLYLKATAGVRLLSKDKQDILLNGLLKELSSSPSENNHKKINYYNCPFIINNNNDHIGVISGNDEGYYAALSVNYLMGSINSELLHHNPSSTTLFGALDMGGASTQIVFKPSHPINNQQSTLNEIEKEIQRKLKEEEEEEKELNMMQEVEISMNQQLPMQVNYINTPISQTNYSKFHKNDFFSQSFLSFGADKIREKYWSYLISIQDLKNVNHHSIQEEEEEEDNDEDDRIKNPCAFVGLENEWEGKVLVGTGDAKTCAIHIKRVIFGSECSHDDIDFDDDYDDKEEEEEESNDILPKSHLLFPTKDDDLKIMKKERCPLDGHHSVKLPQVQGVEFIAMSIYFFALDCMRSLSHLLENGKNNLNFIEFDKQWPSPSIQSLFLASTSFCELSWNEVSSPDVYHRWTWNDQMPHRCFETVFIATLLKEGYGIHPKERAVTYALELEGMEVEWTLGYMLSQISQG
jgi:hypothetical protein